MYAQLPQPSLETLARNIERDAVRSKRLIRQLLDEDHEEFVRSALQVLKEDVESPGAQHLIAVMAAGGLLLSALSDPALDRDQALAVAQAAARLEPTIDVTLARKLVESAGEEEHHPRLMEILAVISDGIRIFPSLVRLLRHPNPHIRSKAVLMIGRGNRSPQWIRQRLSDTDPRFRANAAEALWGVDTEPAREVLQSLVHDSNNRVAGNAILGLYKLGDQSMIPEIVAMAGHEFANHRATAAWVMGETGDPRFTELVAGLLREPNVVVRKRAFSALGMIRAAVSQAARGPRWRLAARLLEPEPGKPLRRVMIGVAGAHTLVPTQVFASEDGEPVVRYRFVERVLPETMSVVFLAPRGGGDSVRACLPWKRPSDLWSCLYYARESSPTAPPVGIRFQSNADALAADLERAPSPTECLDVWRSLAAVLKPESGGIGGRRHVILFSDAADRPSPGEDLRALVAAAQAFVQVVSTGPDPAVEEFCRAVGGIFRVASEEAAIDACLTLALRYELSFQPVNPEARTLKVRVHGPGMLCEAALAIPNPTPGGS